MHKNLRNLIPQFLEKFQYANIILAYRKPDIARRLLDVGNTDNSAGRIGFLPMNVQVDSWLSALRLLLSGECFVPNELLSHDDRVARDTPLFPPQAAPTPIGAEDRTPQPAPNADVGAMKNKDEVCLTERELQVLRSVAEGKQNKIIADELKLSQHTVKLHLHHVISKLGVHNRTEAAIWFLGCRGETNGR
ncbi:hypothetical protein AN191_16505 [Loktanella sp. 5RATIMAR09]|nr:hypothetical protein AN191_16505 [Loktanella sp. 5RATIMAR09]